MPPLPDENAPAHEQGRVTLVWHALRRANRHNVTNLAAALAYYAFLSLPAVLLVALGLFGLYGSPSTATTLVARLGRIVPIEVQTLLEGSLRRLTQQTGTSTVVLVVGIVVAVWSLTGAMQNVMWALNTVYERPERRGFVHRRLNALALLVFGMLGFALSFGVLALGPHLSTWIGNALGQKRIVQLIWWVGEWPLLIVGLLVVYGGLMRFGPSLERPRWRVTSFGSIVAVILWLAASGAFAFYAAHFSSYNKTWGAIAAVVVMLTWLWLSSVILLLGAEIDAEGERAGMTAREPVQAR